MFAERKRTTLEEHVEGKRVSYVRKEFIDADPGAFRLAAEYDLACPEEYVVRSWEAMKALRVGDRLKEITTPSLMIAGAADGLLSSNFHDYRLLPHASLHVFSRTAHYPNKEVPEDFARVVLDFLAHGPSNPASHFRDMVSGVQAIHEGRRDRRKLAQSKL